MGTFILIADDFFLLKKKKNCLKSVLTVDTVRLASKTWVSNAIHVTCGCAHQSIHQQTQTGNRPDPPCSTDMSKGEIQTWTSQKISQDTATQSRFVCSSETSYMSTDKELVR